MRWTRREMYTLLAAKANADDKVRQEMERMKAQHGIR